MTLVLWAAVLARRGWARTALMAVCALEAIAELAHVSATAGRPGAGVLLDAGAAVLILIVVSSDDARRWVASRRSPAPGGASGASARPG